MAPFGIRMASVYIKSVSLSMTIELHSKLSFGHILMIIPTVAQIHCVQPLTEYP